MGLAEMIMDSSSRRQALIERPANLLKANEEFRTNELAKADYLKTAAQNRKASEAGIESQQTRDRLAGRQQDNADQTAAQNAELFPLQKEREEIALESVKQKKRAEMVSASRGVPEQTVNQIIKLNELYINGDVEAGKQRDLALKSLVGSPDMLGMLAYNPAYAEMSKLEDVDLFNDLPAEELEAKKQEMFRGLSLNMKALQANELAAAQRAAASALTQSAGQQYQKTSEENLANAGLPLGDGQTSVAKPVEVTAGEQSDIQNTMGNFLSSGVLKEAGQDAGKAWFSKNLDKDGSFAKAVGGMPGPMYNEELPSFKRFLEIALSPELGPKNTEELYKKIDAISDSGIFAVDSPFRLKLLDLKNKKVKLSNLRDITLLKPAKKTTSMATD